MLAAEGYRPEYGARELKRQIRSLVETRLARAMLGGEVAQGDTVRIGWDAKAEQVRIEPEGKAEAGKDKAAAE
jgi:ATP-dependent Clp protease ATP-binding subunit ClpC